MAPLVYTRSRSATATEDSPPTTSRTSFESIVLAAIAARNLTSSDLQETRSMPEVDPIQLLQAIDESHKRASTKSLDISLNELADMYETGELRIDPEYQRNFRWSDEKQSQFIESLLLNMPIPPLFAFVTDDEKWELIDGLQRLSSYLHFRGVLVALELEEPINKGDVLTLDGCDIVSELNGCTFASMPTALQIRLKRSFLTIELVQSTTAPELRYQMFKRLNTGGETLSDQEVRNCTLRLLGDRFLRFIKELNANTDFRTCIDTLTAEAVRQQRDQELVLRYFAFKNSLEDFRHDIGPFLTKFAERATQHPATFDEKLERDTFATTFSLLARALGNDAFRARRSCRYVGGFSMHHFEAISIALAHCVGESKAGFLSPDELRNRLERLKDDVEFTKMTTGGGHNRKSKYVDKIKAVRNAIVS